MDQRLWGQIVRVSGPAFVVRDPSGAEWPAVLRGRLKKGERTATAAACIGDEVEFIPLPTGQAVIERVLPRRTYLVRQAPLGGRRSHGQGPAAQVLAANVDAAVVVVAAPGLRRTVADRFLQLAGGGGVRPVLCVNKMDLLAGPVAEATVGAAVEPYRRAGVPVVLTSAVTGFGLGTLRAELEGRLVAFVGPSGVGKSSLLNALCPKLDLRTRELEARGRGRHTTTWAAVYDIGGALVVDTPGLREVAFAASDAEGPGPLPLFGDVDDLAPGCRFRDCTHTHEPGCAVKAAVASGELDEARYRQYLKLRRALERGGP